MSKKDRIAVFAPEIHEPFIEGVQKAAWKIINEIAKSEIDVFLYTQKSYGTDANDAQDHIRINYVFNTGKVRIIKYFRWVYDAFFLTRQVLSLKASRLLVFSLDWPFLPLLSVLCLVSKLSIRVVMFSTREVGSVGKIFLKLFGNKVGIYFVASLRIKEMLIDIGIDDSRIIFLPVHFTKNKHSVSKNIERNQKSVLYLSSAEKEAGIVTMLEVASLMSDFTFTLAVRDFGDSHNVQYQWLIDEVDSRGLSNVTIKQNINNVGDELRGAGAVVLPPLSEDYSMALPLVLLEAFETRTPVITSNLPIFEFYEASDYIQIFNTTEELAHILSELASSNNECTMVEKAHDFVLNMTNTKEAAHIYIK